MKGEDGWAPMTKIGQYIANNSSLSQKNYGYARWSDLMRATEYFEDMCDAHHQPSFRSKKAAAAAA
jgi:pentatricopeptide repeat protein